MTEVTATGPSPHKMPPGIAGDLDYWYAFIDEKTTAAEFNVTPRYLQNLRQHGDPL